jgi:hypothetical protein
VCVCARARVCVCVCVLGGGVPLVACTQGQDTTSAAQGTHRNDPQWDTQPQTTINAAAEHSSAGGGA